MADLTKLDPGVPGLAGIAVSLNTLAALNRKGLLTDQEVRSLMADAMTLLASPEQKAAAIAMIKAVMPNCGL